MEPIFVLDGPRTYRHRVFMEIVSQRGDEYMQIGRTNLNTQITAAGFDPNDAIIALNYHGIQDVWALIATVVCSE